MADDPTEYRLDQIDKRFDEVFRRFEEAHRGREILHDRLTAMSADSTTRREGFDKQIYEMRLLFQQIQIESAGTKAELADIKSKTANKADVEAIVKRLDSTRIFIAAIITPLVGGILAAAVRMAFGSAPLP